MPTTDELKSMSRDEFYSHCLQSGCSPGMAAMLADRRPPASKTSTEFLRAYGCNGRQFEHCPQVADVLVDMTRRHDPNFSPTGKVLLGGLCQYPGDPAAWVPADSSARDYVKKLCESRGQSCEGMVEVAGAEPGPVGKYRVADDLVEKRAAVMRKENPKLSTGESREAAREVLTPKDLQ